MANPNSSSLLFTYLIISSLSWIISCNADSSEGTGDGHKFSYDEGSPDGPKKWGTLSAEFKLCADGETQSPIDIEVKKAKDQPNDLKKAYKQAPAKLFHRGHNIAVEWQGEAGGIEVNGSTYKLVQCHWHTPSEHTIDGKSKYDAELHFVHSNDKKQKAVIGVLFAIGESDSFIEQLSESKFKEISSNGNDLGKVSASSVTCGSKKYFRYSGSLTTHHAPTVLFGRLQKRLNQFQRIKSNCSNFKGSLDQVYQENSRPVQELNGRTVAHFEEKEDTGEDTKDSGTESSTPILQVYN